MNHNTALQPKRITATLAFAILCCAAPAISFADPSDTNHGNSTNASANGIAHSNVNGIGSSTNGTAPVPETSTYVAMGSLLALAAYARMRRRAAAHS